MNIINKTIAIFSPKSALRRLTNSIRLKQMETHLRRYEGAAEGRRFSGFRMRSNQSFNKILQQDLKNLVLRSRELSMNNPYARKAAYTIANNVVGTGIIPEPIVLTKDKSGKIIAGKNKSESVETVKSAWKQWGESTECDYDGDYNFYGLQWLVMKTIVVSGEVLIIKKSVKADVSRIGIQLKVIEGDFIDNSKDSDSEAGGGYTVNGVKFNSQGKKLGYWIFDRHPSDGNANSVFVNSEDVIHVYDVERAGQTRGVPFAASTIIRQRDLDDYEDAELLGKKAASCMPIFVQNNSPEATNSNSEDERIESIEPGMISYLAPGETVTFATPPANNGFSDFTKTQHRAIAGSYLITYEQLTGDLSNVNFSSGRMGWIESQRQIEMWQWLMLVPKFCDKAYKWFTEGVTIADGLGTDMDIKATWTAPRRQMIDPSKETNAKRVAMRSGLQSWRETVKQDGYNPEEVLLELKEDQEKFVAAGLMPDWTQFFEIQAQLKQLQEKQNATANKKEQV